MNMILLVGAAVLALILVVLVLERRAQKRAAIDTAADDSAADVEDKSTTSSARRVIPATSAVILAQRAARLMQEENFHDALVCYMALLSSAVRQGDAGAGETSLPINVTECLRGAAMCYRGLGEPEKAVKFLQAERLVYEELVAETQSVARGEGPNGTQPSAAGILAALFTNKSGAALDGKIPKRYTVLTEVGDACMKHGYPEVALSYRVKAAALRQRASGKPLDSDSAELAAMAEAINVVEERRAAGGQ